MILGFDISFSSYNVQGMVNMKKCEEILTWLKIKNPYIISCYYRNEMGKWIL